MAETDMHGFLDEIERTALADIERVHLTGLTLPYLPVTAAGLIFLSLALLSTSQQSLGVWPAVLALGVGLLAAQASGGSENVRRLVRTMRSHVRANLLDEGLLRHVLEYDSPGRLPSLVAVTLPVIGLRVGVTEADSLRGRLLTLMRRYPQCCKDAGLRPWDTFGIMARDEQGWFIAGQRGGQETLLRSAVALELVAAMRE